MQSTGGGASRKFLGGGPARGPLGLVVDRDRQWPLLQYAEVLDVLEEGLVVLMGHENGVDRLYVLLQLLHVALELGPAILEPRDDLGVAEAKLGGDLVAIGRRQVLLVEEALLELEDLLVREGRPALSLLLRLLPVVEQVQVIGLF